jgi:hypothetical protein
VHLSHQGTLDFERRIRVLHSCSYNDTTEKTSTSTLFCHSQPRSLRDTELDAKSKWRDATICTWPQVCACTRKAHRHGAPRTAIGHLGCHCARDHESCHRGKAADAHNVRFKLWVLCVVLAVRLISPVLFSRFSSARGLLARSGPFESMCSYRCSWNDRELRLTLWTSCPCRRSKTGRFACPKKYH